MIGYRAQDSSDACWREGGSGGYGGCLRWGFLTTSYQGISGSTYGPWGTESMAVKKSSDNKTLYWYNNTGQSYKEPFNSNGSLYLFFGL